MNHIGKYRLQTPSVIPAKIDPILIVFPHTSALFPQETRAVCSHFPQDNPLPVPVQLSSTQHTTLSYLSICCQTLKKTIVSQGLVQVTTYCISLGS